MLDFVSFKAMRYAIDLGVTMIDYSAKVEGSIRHHNRSLNKVTFWTVMKAPAGTILYKEITSGSYVPLI